MHIQYYYNTYVCVCVCFASACVRSCVWPLVSGRRLNNSQASLAQRQRALHPSSPFNMWVFLRARLFWSVWGRVHACVCTDVCERECVPICACVCVCVSLAVCLAVLYYITLNYNWERNVTACDLILNTSITFSQFKRKCACVCVCVCVCHWVLFAYAN